MSRICSLDRKRDGRARPADASSEFSPPFSLPFPASENTRLGDTLASRFPFQQTSRLCQRKWSVLIGLLISESTSSSSPTFGPPPSQRRRPSSAFAMSSSLLRASRSSRRSFATAASPFGAAPLGQKDCVRTTLSSPFSLPFFASLLLCATELRGPQLRTMTRFPFRLAPPDLHHPSLPAPS